MRNGMSIFEVVIAVAIFAVIATGFVGAYTLSVQSRKFAADQTHAVFLAEEGLEAARNIRDNNFSNLVNGTWGLAMTSNQWAFSGSQDITAGFTREIVVTSADSSTKQIVANVSWRTPGRTTSTVSLATYLINFLYPTQASCLVVNTSSASMSGFDLQGVTLGNACGIAAVIDQMTISWTNPLLTALTQITINGTNVWSGIASSGSTLNITNVTLPSGTTAMPLTHFVFDTMLTGRTFTITFIMADGSSQIITLSP